MKTATLSALTMIFASTAATAGHYRPVAKPAPLFDEARVVSSQPVFEEFNEPRRECWVEQSAYTYERERPSAAGALLGTVVGGVIGHQFGKGSGRDAATAVGAVIGAIAGNESGDRRVVRRPVEEQRCRTVDNWSRRITGYDVVYRYQGQEYSAFLPYDPGNSVRVRVDVSLDDRR